MNGFETVKEPTLGFERLDTENIGRIFAAFEQRIADNLPGTTTEQRTWIEQQLATSKRALATLRNIEKGHAMPAGRLEELHDLGIDPGRLDDADKKNIQVFAEFFETLASVAAYLDQSMADDWPRKKRDQENAPQELQRCGAEANVKFVDFFIKTQKLLGLPDGALEDLYYELFGRRGATNLRSELERVSLDEFPRGILAAIRAYVFLKGQVPEKTFVRVPDVSEDLYWGVDLISETQDETGRVIAKNLYQVKGRAGDTADMFDLSNPKEKDRLMALISTLPEWDRQKHIDTMERLVAYQKIQQRDNPQMRINAYWVEVILPKDELKE